MRALPTALPEVLLIEPAVHRDARGFFLETYHVEKYADAGMPLPFVQDNHSRSAARTLRGLHAQVQQPQGKLVRVLDGAIFDVAVDARRTSPTFRRWVGIELSADNFRQLYIPPGFLHGFCVLSESADVAYKCTALWQPGDEITVRWDDPAIGIEWPIAHPVLSAKDGTAPPLSELLDRLPA
ncbi:MAG: dTDP-4-dehydrorhamnose 3,5-epimerase [Candidatus Binatia bacterium]